MKKEISIDFKKWSSVIWIIAMEAIFLHIIQITARGRGYNSEDGAVWTICSVIVMIMCGIALLGWFYMSFPLHRVFFFMALSLGMTYLLFIPLFTVPDEGTHINTAYYVSNVLMGAEHTYGQVYMRGDDAAYPRINAGFSRLLLRNYFLDITKGLSDESMYLVSGGTLPWYVMHQYLIAGVGITVGRLLHMGALVTLLLGRFFNLLFYTACGTYAIKKMPQEGKYLLFIIALLPMSLQQAASYSYDCVVIALSFMIVSLSIFLLRQEESGKYKKEIVILIIACILFLPSKQFAYFALCLLPLLIPVKWYMRKKEITINKKSKIICVGVMAALCLIVFVIERHKGKGMVTTGNYIFWANEDGYTVPYIAANIRVCTNVFIDTLCVKLHWYILGFIGIILGQLELVANQTWAFVYMGLIFLTSFSMEKHQLLLEKKEKLCFVGAALITIACIFGGMWIGWTPLSSKYIEGVQGRYFIPVAFPLFILFNSDKIKVRESVLKVIPVIIAICSYMVIYDAFMLYPC